MQGAMLIAPKINNGEGIMSNRLILRDNLEILKQIEEEER